MCTVFSIIARRQAPRNDGRMDCRVATLLAMTEEKAYGLLIIDGRTIVAGLTFELEQANPSLERVIEEAQDWDRRVNVEQYLNSNPSADGNGEAAASPGNAFLMRDSVSSSSKKPQNSNFKVEDFEKDAG